MSHELIAYWNRRLTRTPPLFARSPLGLDQLWLFELCFAFQDRGRREQNLKNHKRHVPATSFCTGVCNAHGYAIVRGMSRCNRRDPIRLNLRGESLCDNQSQRRCHAKIIVLKMSSPLRALLAFRTTRLSYPSK
jgi:hypothetical protein